MDQESQATICQNMSLMRHDLRNRLSALRLELYLLERKVNPELRRTVEMMKDEIGAMNLLLNDLDYLPIQCQKS